MSMILLKLGIGAALGAALGYFGQCTSGTCPLTSTWWRGALYGGVLGLIFGVASGPGTPKVPASAPGESMLVKEVGQEQFDLALKKGGPVLVDFYADWCGPCKTMAPRVAEVARAYEGKLTVLKVNVDNSPDLARRFNVEGIPTLMLFSAGQPVATVVGLVKTEALRSKVDELVNAAPKVVASNSSE